MSTNFYSSSYIYDPYTGYRFEFQVNPSTISDGRSITISQAAPPGAHLQRTVPGNGERNPISFSVPFVAQDAQHRTGGWVKKMVQFLYSLTYPRITRPGINVVAITPVFLVLGDLLELPVYVQKVSTEWGPFLNKDLAPLMASCRLECIEVAEEGEFIDAMAAAQGASMGKAWTFEVPQSSRTEFFFSSTEADANFDFGGAALDFDPNNNPPLDDEE